MADSNVTIIKQVSDAPPSITQTSAAIEPVTPTFDPEPILQQAQILRSQADLARFIDEIRSARIIGIDTESAGFHRYSTDVCLIQVATGKTCALIDPLAIPDLSPLATIAGDPQKEWVFHGADYDLRQIRSRCGATFSRIFDTRIAAELLGLDTLGLAGITEALFGLTLDKKLQRCDWSYRPLTSAMMRYALLDAVCLVPVRARLRDRLRRKGRLGWADEEFRHAIAQAGIAEADDHSRDFMIKGSGQLPTRSLLVLREIHQLRDRLARERNRSPFMIIGNDALLDIARQMPGSKAGLSVIRGIGQHFVQRYGDQLLAAVRRGLTAPADSLPPRLPTRERPHSLTAWEGDLLTRLRERRDQVARTHGLNPTFLAAHGVLDTLVRTRPVESLEVFAAVAGLARWRAELLFEPCRELLSQTPPPSPVGRRRSRRRRRGSAGNQAT